MKTIQKLSIAADSLSTMLKNLFDQQKDCDVTFNVSNEDIKAHKLILSNRSTVLKTMINNSMAYVDGKILISDPDVTFVDFKAFLRFLYTDECEIAEENVKTMLHLAHMYDVPLLFKKCTDFIQKILTGSNILEYAELGLLYSDQSSLLSKCLKQISIMKCFPKKDDTKKQSSYEFSFRGASNELVLKIVQDCKRIGEFTEDKLFGLVFDWAKNECSENSETTLKDVLKDSLPFINFEDLKPLTLATTVKENKFLSDKELLDALVKSTINESNKPVLKEVIENPVLVDSKKSHSSPLRTYLREAYSIDDL